MKKQTHKLLAVLLAAIMILSALSLETLTVGAERSGLYTYEIVDGKAVITQVSDIIEGDVVIPEYLGGYKTVGIGEHAFENCEYISSVVVPEYIEFVGQGAFCWCRGLSRVEILGDITRIENSTFYWCTSLTDIQLPKTIDYIGYGAFENVGYRDKESNWDNGVLYISKYIIDAKYGISGTYTIKDGTRTIANEAFKSCSFDKIVLPESLISIGDNAFESCVNLQRINVTNNVNRIGKSAFAWCGKLTNFTIPEGVSEIEASTFCGCTSITKIDIPKSVTKICQDAFFGCEKLEKVILHSGLIEIEKFAFYNCSNLKSIYIPEGVLSLGYAAFSNCVRLQTLSLPLSILELDYSFDSCDSLTEVYYAGNESQKEKIEGINYEYYLNTSTWHYGLPPCEHAYTMWVTKSKPTMYDRGFKQETCTACGEILGEAEIPALGVTYDIENAAKNEAENVSVAVSAESNLPQTVAIVAEKAEVTQDSITYEIHLENEGEQIQPDAPVLVKLPIPAGFEKNILNVYRKEADGSKTRMDITVDGDFAYFETDHFSIYEILEKLCGDINSDDKVNNKDLTRLFQYLSKWKVEVKEAALDINGDGKVNNKDLTRLFQHLSKWDVEIF